MRIRPFSQLRCIQTGRLLSVGEQRERAPSRVGTGGRSHDPAMSDNIKDKALMCCMSGHDSAHDWRWKANCPK